MGSCVCSSSDLSTGYVAPNWSGSRSLLFFVSRPLSFPVTQSYLISCTATREEDPGVLMLIRAVGRLLAGLEEPERRQETRSNTVTENLLQLDGNEMGNCIWSDFEICRMSRKILIKQEPWVVFVARWPATILTFKIYTPLYEIFLNFVRLWFGPKLLNVLSLNKTEKWAESDALLSECTEKDGSGFIWGT